MKSRRRGEIPCKKHALLQADGDGFDLVDGVDFERFFQPGRLLEHLDQRGYECIEFGLQSSPNEILPAFRDVGQVDRRGDVLHQIDADGPAQVVALLNRRLH